jgi:hypothetical protein
MMKKRLTPVCPAHMNARSGDIQVPGGTGSTRLACMTKTRVIATPRRDSISAKNVGRSAKCRHSRRAFGGLPAGGLATSRWMQQRMNSA